MGSLPVAAAVNVAGDKDSAGQLTGVAPAAVKADRKNRTCATYR